MSSVLSLMGIVIVVLEIIKAMLLLIQEHGFPIYKIEA
jgi:hypothetical protein